MWFYGKEMRPKCQVATHEASAHYANFGIPVDLCVVDDTIG